MVDLSPFTVNAPPEAKNVIQRYRDEIIDGTFKVFKGPIKDQLGVEKVPKGSILSEQEVMALSWLIEGVYSTADK